jgi:hypothetical protein
MSGVRTLSRGYCSFEENAKNSLGGLHTDCRRTSPCRGVYFWEYYTSLNFTADGLRFVPQQIQRHYNCRSLSRPGPRRVFREAHGCTTNNRSIETMAIHVNVDRIMRKRGTRSRIGGACGSHLGQPLKTETNKARAIRFSTLDALEWVSSEVEEPLNSLRRALIFALALRGVTASYTAVGTVPCRPETLPR